MSDLDDDELRELYARCRTFLMPGEEDFGMTPVEALARDGRGFDAGVARVPLVPTAILFDLGFGDPLARPGRALVERALHEAAAGEVAVGSVGAGTGATVGKACGRERGAAHVRPFKVRPLQVGSVKICLRGRALRQVGVRQIGAGGNELLQ